MMLQLADRGAPGVKRIYDLRGNCINVPLASKASRKAKKEVKTAKKQAKVAKKQAKVVKKQEKAKRIVNKAQAKTANQQVKLVGKQEIIKSKVANKVAKQQQSMNPEFDQQDADMAPLPRIPGSAPMNKPSIYQPQPQYSSQYNDEILYSPGDVLPEEYYEDGSSTEDWQDAVYAEDENYDEYPPELAAGGIFGTILNAVGGAAKGAIQSVTKGGTQGIVNKAKSKVTNTVAEFNKLKVENGELKMKVSSLQTQRWLFAAGGTAVGVGIGYAISKRRR